MLKEGGKPGERAPSKKGKEKGKEAKEVSSATIYKLCFCFLVKFTGIHILTLCSSAIGCRGGLWSGERAVNSNQCGVELDRESDAICWFSLSNLSFLGVIDFPLLLNNNFSKILSNAE